MTARGSLSSGIVPKWRERVVSSSRSSGTVCGSVTGVSLVRSRLGSRSLDWIDDVVGNQSMFWFPDKLKVKLLYEKRKLIPMRHESNLLATKTGS